MLPTESVLPEVGVTVREMPRTAIAIGTRRRPESLASLLKVLAAEYGSDEDVSLVVIDNDPLGSSKEIVEKACGRFLGSVIYRVEPKEGYASVRNAAVAAAQGVNYLAFIDDDEIPEPGWLTSLHDARRRYDADVVAGAVITNFPPGTPTWLRTSKVMSSEQPKLKTGASMTWCATSNVLVAYRVFENTPSGFDTRFDRTGGEDTHFFLRTRVAGFKIVWSNEARVHETISSHRTRVSWILRRAARTGNNKALIEIEILRSPPVIAVRAAKALALLMIGASTMAVGIGRRDRGTTLRGLQRWAEGAGTMAGMIGIRLA